MNITDKTLLEQLNLSTFGVEKCKSLFSISPRECQLLEEFKPTVMNRIDQLVTHFYKGQIEVPEIALMIGDAETLERLHKSQRQYILDLFSGLYDMEYVNHRLHVALMHRRMNIELRLYLASMTMLKNLLFDLIFEMIPGRIERNSMIKALDSLVMFDIKLLIEVYVQSLNSEIEISRTSAEQYVVEFERSMGERIKYLEELVTIDGLTGLLNVRYLGESLTRILRGAQRRQEYVSVVFLDVNDFKEINDLYGHQRGDELLREMGAAIKKVSRGEDNCFRYGGDEFCMILPNCREAEARERYVERLHQELVKNRVNVEFSVGIVEAAPDAFIEPSELIRLADKRMYVAKKQKGM